MNTLLPAARTAPSARSWGMVALLLGAATVAGVLLDAYVSLTSLAMMYVLTVIVACAGHHAGCGAGGQPAGLGPAPRDRVGAPE